MGRGAATAEDVVLSPREAASAKRPKLEREDVVAKVMEFGGGRGAVKQAAAFFGVTSAAISWHLKQANRGLMATRPDDDRLREVWQEAGGDLARACEILGCSEKSGRRWFGPDDLGLFEPRAYNTWTPEEEARLARRYVVERNKGRRSEFAETFTRHSKDTVFRKASKLAAIDLSDAIADAPRPWQQHGLTREELDELYGDLRDSGLTLSAWARQEGQSNQVLKEMRRSDPERYDRERNAAQKRHGKSKAEVGRGFEIEVSDHLRRSFRRRFGLDDYGNRFSYGASDLVLTANGRMYAIQCERNSTSLGKDKWDRLYAWAKLHGNAVPIFARQGANGPEFYRLTDTHPGDTRRQRAPMEPFDFEADLLQRESEMTDEERRLAALARPEATRRSAKKKTAARS